MCEDSDEKFTIRPVTHADLGGVRDVLVTTWHATYDEILGDQQVEAITADWHSIEALERQRLVPNAAFLVAELEGHIVGTAFARSGADDCILLRRMYVRPHAQGRGLGRQLLAACLATFPGARAAQLEVEPRNARAIAFYERAGFQVVSEGEGCGGCGSGIRHLVMEKRLA
jgi:ribosomal protein S18 acetylase RimI-like enzyme